MLRLRNAESGRVVAVPTAAGQGIALRVPAPPPGSGAVAGLLAADLIRRVLGRHRVRVLASYGAAPPDGFNLYPPDEITGPPARPTGLLVAWDGGREAAAFVVRPALPDLTAPPAPGDPLAVRLALLGRHYTDASPLAAGDVAAAEEQLDRWRGAVAGWADLPSRAMCADHLARFTDACDDDLNTATALQALRDLEADPEIPAGSKFETFVHVDAILGLDLMRDIGRPH